MKWYKVIPPKKLHNEFGLYQGVWMPNMDRCWESEEGYSVMSRQIKLDFGVVEHITIQRICGFGDVPWDVKQEIKDDLFGYDRIAIEVFPAKKHLVDVCDVYHLWLMPKGFKMPFGIQPYKDPQGKPVERGYDYDMDRVAEWIESDTRKRLVSEFV